MSDDTPTQRYDLGDDAPTQRLETPDAAVPPAAPQDRASRRLIIILASIGAVLLVALIILLVVLLTRGSTPAPAPTPTTTPSVSPSPSASPTPSDSPSPTPTPTPTQTVAPPPPSTAATVDSFTINPTSVDCSGGTGSVVITLKWATSNANNVYFGVDTGGADAQEQPFFADSLPASGTSTNDFPDGYRPFEYTCGNGSHTYVITAVGSDNTTDTVTVQVNG